MALTPIGDLLIAIKADVDDYQKSMATVSDINRGLSSSFEQLGSVVRNFGAVITAVSAVGAAALAGLSFAGGRLQTAFLEVGAMLQGTETAMQRFGGVVSDVTEKFAIQGGRLTTTSALYDVVSAGFRDAAAAQNILSEASVLATVGVTDLDTATRSLVGTMNEFGVEAGNAERVTKTIFGTMAEGLITVEELVQVLGRVTAIAANAGVSLEEVGAGMATLTAAGLRSNEAATSLRAIISGMLNPSEDMIDALTELAVRNDFWGDSMGDTYNRLQEVRGEISQLEGESKKLSAEIKLLESSGMDIASVLKDMNVDLVNQQSEVMSTAVEFANLSGELQGLQGEFDKLSGKMRENRIKIKEIRLAAKKEGRELTQAEKERVNELELANEELRLNQMKTRQEMMKTEREMADTREELHQKGLDVTDEELENEDKRAQAILERVTALQSANQAVSERKSEEKELSETWQRMEGSLGKLALENQAFGETLFDLKKVADDLNIPISALFRNIRAQAGVMPILNQGMKDWNSTLENIEAQGKSVDEVMNRFQDSTAFKFRRAINNLKGSMQDFGLVIAEDFIPVVESIGNFIGNLKDNFNDLEDSTQGAISKFLVMMTVGGLILGPLMLIGGQIMVIVGALGTYLIPVLITAGAILGIAANKFKELQQGGEEGQKAMDSFRSTVSGLIQTAKSFASIFREELLPGLMEFAEGLSDWGQAAIDAFTGVMDESGGLKESIRNVVSAIGDLFETTGVWLQENDEIISGIVKFGAKILKALLPAIGTLLEGIVDVVDEFLTFTSTILETEGGQEAIAGIGKAIIVVVEAVATLVEWTGKLLSALSPIIGPLITIGIMLAGASAIASKLAAAFAAIAGPSYIFLAVMQSLAGIVTSVIGLFSGVVGALGILTTIVGKAVAAIKVIAGIIAWLGGPITLLIVAIGLLASAIYFNWFGIRDIISRVVTTIIGYLGRFKQWILGIPEAARQFYEKHKMWFSLFGGLIALLSGPIGWLLVAWRNNWGDIQGKTKSAIDSITWWLDYLWGYLTIIGGFFKDMGGMAKDALGTLKQQFIDGIKAIIDWIKNNGKSILSTAIDNLLQNPLINPLSLLPEDAKKWGKNLINEFVAGIKKKAPKVGTWAKKVASKVEEYIGIFSDAEKGPLSNLTKWGPNLVGTFAKDIKNGASEIQGAMESVVPGALNVARDGMVNMSGGSSIGDVTLIIEKGAFQGVAEDELPQVVGEEVDSRFQEILDKMEGKGA